MKDIYVVSPVYNEVESISPFCAEVQRVFKEKFHGKYRMKVVLVDDGSSDGSFGEIEKAASFDQEGFSVHGVQLSRNFGQQGAIQAGLEQSFESAEEGSYFMILDSDLQHPPSLLAKMAEALENGADHVQMQRADSKSLSMVKNLTSSIFYKVFSYLTKIEMQRGSSDFRAFNYNFLKAYLRLKEKGRFNRGLFYWVGFQREDIFYEPADRTRGESKYTLEKMASLAMAGISQFSSKPLIIINTAITLLSFGICAIYFGYEIAMYLGGREFVLGWSSLIMIVTFWGGAISLGQLMIAIYISRIFDETKGRPTYVLRKGLEESRKTYLRTEQTG